MADTQTPPVPTVDEAVAEIEALNADLARVPAMRERIFYLRGVIDASTPPTETETPT